MEKDQIKFALRGIGATLAIGTIVAVFVWMQWLTALLITLLAILTEWQDILIRSEVARGNRYENIGTRARGWRYIR